jgi:hypothetical protein
LRQMKIPLGVATIGWQAFITCSHLKLVEIPLSVTAIGRYAFNGCSCFRELEIPASVMTIEEGAFYRCSGLTRLYIPSSVITLMNWAFYGYKVHSSATSQFTSYMVFEPLASLSRGSQRTAGTRFALSAIGRKQRPSRARDASCISGS